MPATRNYNPGSIVFFQGDRGDDVYVLQKGRVVLISTALDTGEEEKQEVQKGEFFGVKSSLGRYPREETAQVLGPTTLLIFKQTEFEKLVLQNTRLIMKMLRVFSKQLRDIHRQVRQVMKTGAAREPSFELMNVAESFFRLGNLEHAEYAFNQYLKHYPNGPYTERALDMKEMTKRGTPYPIGYPQLEEISSSARSANSGPGGQSGIEQTGAISGGGIQALFHNGLDAFNRKEYENSLNFFNMILNSEQHSDQEESNLFSRAHFEKARAEMKLKRIAEATASFTNYIKKFGTGEYVKEAIFDLGLLAEMQGNLERAKSLYHKVATMPPQDAVTNEARKRLQKVG